MTKLITVWQRFDFRKTKVDDDDFESLNKIHWVWHETSSGIYIRHNISYGVCILMHRLIMHATDGLEVDHKNLDTLDNRKKNLRIATHTDNGRNRKKYNGHTSQYKGVSWETIRRKWHAQIKVNQVQIFIGRFDNEEEAALAYNKRALIEFGEFARLNKIL